jgi:hypothetical protein
MEIFPYMFSVLLTALVLYWSRVTARRKPGTPVSGLFRYRDKPGKVWRPSGGRSYAPSATPGPGPGAAPRR